MGKATPNDGSEIIKPVAESPDSTQPSADGPALRGQARLGAQRRAVIVDAAIEIFAVRGFRGGALAEVADRAGVTPQGILYHFGSKEALLFEVIAERDRRQGGLLLEMWDPESAHPALESFQAAVQFAEISEREPGLTALLTVLRAESFEPDHPAHDYFVQRTRRLLIMVEAALRFGQESGEVSPDVDCSAKAREWVAFLEGAATVWLLDRSTSLVELYRNFADSFVRSVASESDDG